MLTQAIGKKESQTRQSIGYIASNITLEHGKDTATPATKNETINASIMH